MICIYINRCEEGRIRKFKLMGHSDYAEEGKDIVCAAVSAIVQTAAMGISDIANIDMEYSQKEGYVSLSLPQDLSTQQMRDAHVILETMLIGIKSIELQYSSFVYIRESEVK